MNGGLLKNIKFIFYFNLMISPKINLMHIFLIGPLLSYIGIQGKNTPQIFYGVLLGFVLILNFVINTPELKLNYRSQIDWIHSLGWTSLFFYVCYTQSELPDYMFEIIKYLGFSVCIVHSYILYQKYQNKPDDTPDL
jgi:hypothetical protein